MMLECVEVEVEVFWNPECRRRYFLRSLGIDVLSDASVGNKAFNGGVNDGEQRTVRKEGLPPRTTFAPIPAESATKIRDRRHLLLPGVSKARNSVNHIPALQSLLTVKVLRKH